MASSAAAATMPSGAGASGSPANGTSLAGASKSHFKPNAAAKPMDGGRRQSGSPVDGPQRRPSSHKAWTQGTNPITQRNINNALPNGNPPQARNAVKNSPAPQNDMVSPDKQAHDRLVYLLANFIGRPATITVKNGDGFVGIFSGSSFETTETSWLLKMVKRKPAGAERLTNGVDPAGSGYVGSGPEHAMCFDVKDVVDLAVDGVTFGDQSSKGPDGIPSGSSFRTDADISGHQAVRERTLQRWQPSTDHEAGLALEDNTDSNVSVAGSNGTWDQFETNERLYGIKSDYDENLYTTAIDRSDPLYKERSARAEKIAREIEASNAMNAHVAEERGAARIDDSGRDEEEKYSEVKRGPTMADELASPQAMTNKYTPPARRAPVAPPAVPAAPQDPAIVASQKARPDPAVGPPAEAKARNEPASAKTLPPARENRIPAVPAEANAKPRAALPAATAIPSKAGPTAKTNLEVNAKQPASLIVPGPNNLTSPRAKAPGESATATVEHDVRDAFKQFASGEKMRMQERRRNQAKHDKDIKLNDLKKFSQNFKLTTPVPKDLVPILAKDKSKQDEIIERAQQAVEANLTSPGSGNRPLATVVDANAAKPLPRAAAAAATTTTATTAASTTTVRQDLGVRPTPPQQMPGDRQNLARARGNQPGPAAVNTQPGRPQPNASMPPGRAGPGLSQRLTNFQQQQLNRGPPAPVHIPAPLPIHDHRGPPTGPSGNVTDTPRYSGAPTPTSATSSHFNARAIEFKPNPNALSFTPTGEPSAASSPRSNLNGASPSRAPTPSGFFGAKKPLPASERPSLDEYFNPLKRLRKEAEESNEEWPTNGGIKPAHKTGPRWDVADANREKTYTEMFEKVPFSTQSVSPQHPPYAAPQLPHQHQLPFHLQHGGPVIPQPATPHQVPHHLHPQQHHHPVVGMPHHFDEHRMHVSSSPSVMPSPRLQQVNMAYQSPMGQHAQVVYGQPVPQYGMAPGGPQMAPLRQYPAGSHFVPQHGTHMAAPMMTHSPSGGHMAAAAGGMPQGVAAPFGQPMPVYSPNPVQAYIHHGGPPPPQPGSNGYPSPGRAAPMMIHQSSQPGQAPHQMMMFGMSPGQQSQHLYVSHPPAQGPAPRAGGYLPPQQPHYAMPPAHHVSAHHRGGPSYGHPAPHPHPPPPPMAHVGAQPATAGVPAHNGADGEEDLK